MSQPWEPDHWFLTEKDQVTIRLLATGRDTLILGNELFDERSRGWKSQNSEADSGAWGMSPAAETELLKPYTSNNEVKELIDGKEYMSNLCGEILLLKDDDFVLIAGWEFWKHRSLVRRVSKKNPGQDGNFLPTVLKRAVDNGAWVRVLAFKQRLPGLWARTENFLKEVEALSPVRASTSWTNPPDFAVSHHQKEVFTGRSDFQNSRAYVGGMDLAVDRWDDRNHNAANVEGRNFGWHDIQVVVQGKAILQLWANFAERWDDRRREKEQQKKEVLPPCPVPKWAKTWASSPATGNKHVQVLRTVAPASKKERERKRFMEDGERTVLCALKKAIEKAKCYIYIEEQFLWDCELADFISSQMKANSDLHLIIVMTAGCELPARLKGYAFHLRSEFFRKVMGLGETSGIVFGDKPQVYPYGLYQRRIDGGKEIYVHSKLIIIDDRYVAIGSANVDARSLHIETELTLGIVDGDTDPSGRLGGKQAIICKFARDLRDRLWKEHLGVGASDASFPSDPIEALNRRFPGFENGWPTTRWDAARRQQHHLRCYINEPGTHRVTPASRNLIDRNIRKYSL